MRRAAPKRWEYRGSRRWQRAITGLVATLISLIGGGCSQGEAPPEAAAGAAAPAGPEVVMPAPDLPDLEFRNQADEPVSLTELRSKPALLTFIYTNCPMPEMCPATALRFQEVQRALPDAVRGKVRLVSVSFDPADTPEVLADYAKLWEADPAVWTMITGSPENIHRLASAYGFSFDPQEGGTFSHIMLSMILLPGGDLHRVLLGSAWDSGEVAGDLARLAQADAAEPGTH